MTTQRKTKRNSKSTVGAQAATEAKAASSDVDELLSEVKIKLKNAKPSVGDYIRLLQLKRELDEEHPKEIKVTWVERCTEETEPSEKEYAPSR